MSDPAASRKDSASIAFGDCLIKVSQRQLLRNGQPVELGDRSFELLLTLIDGYGGLVSKDDLIARVWPGRIIEENTLEGRISLLRRALGADRSAIKTIAGRGYQFVGAFNIEAPVTAMQRYTTVSGVAYESHTEHPGVRLPSSVSKLVGRATALAEIAELAASNRLITLVGTGGTGKTRLAIEAARLLAPGARDGTYLAELGSVVSADFVQMTVGAALGCPSGEGTLAMERIVSTILSRPMLLVLDNCEHVIEAAARLVDRLLRACPNIRIIATSREALRIEGEYVYRVPSLDIPDTDDVSAEVAAASGALQLFRARLRPGAADANAAAQLTLQVRICRRLDGIPLALELAAARVAVLGLQSVADRLDDRFQLLTNGARTALPRQQTLRAALDWSYELLTADERAVLAQLSIFVGNFNLESATAIVSMAGESSDTVTECLSSLVEKSLVSLRLDHEPLRYSLLETTRVYAREKRLASEGSELLSLAHARHFTTLFESSEREARLDVNAAWRNRYAAHLEDFRAAIAWCFGPAGDADTGVQLTLAGMPLSLQLGLLEECIARVTTALAWLDENDAEADARRMKLHAARGTTLLYQTATAEAGKAFLETMQLADRLGDISYQKYGVWGYWCYSYLNGHYAEALALAQRFQSLASLSDQPWDALVGERIVGITHLCLGQLADARAALEHMLAGHPQTFNRHHRIRFLYDEKMLAHTSLAHTLLLQGFPEQAMRMAQLAHADANELAHVPSLCYALSEGVCVIALIAGDSTALAQAVTLLENATRRHGVSTWKARSRIWAALAPLRQGHMEAYDQVIAPALAEIGIARFFISLTPVLTAVALSLSEYGRADDGMSLIVPAIEHARISGDVSSFIELTRAHAQLMLAKDGIESEEAVERQLQAALSIAQANGYLSWELRCALDLARLWLKQKKPGATDRLRAVYARFSEGWQDTDFLNAQELLYRTRTQSA